MTGLLVSVRNAEEAATAVLAGADLIDVKEPLAGSLGAASPDAVADVMLTVGGRRPTSIALGELRENVAWSQYAERLSQVNLPRFVKFGLAGCWRPRPDKERDELIERWRTALAPLPATVGPVAVLYADWQAAESPPPEIILHCAKELHCLRCSSTHSTNAVRDCSAPYRSTSWPIVFAPCAMPTCWSCSAARFAKNISFGCCQWNRIILPCAGPYVAAIARVRSIGALSIFARE